MEWLPLGGHFFKKNKVDIFAFHIDGKEENGLYLNIVRVLSDYHHKMIVVKISSFNVNVYNLGMQKCSREQCWHTYLVGNCLIFPVRFWNVPFAWHMLRMNF